MAYIEERQKRVSGSTRRRTVYRVQIRMKGHSESATFDRKTDAVLWAQQTEADIRAGRHLVATEAKKHTLAELIDRYEDTVLPLKKSANTQKHQYRWWRNRLGHLSLAEISPAIITQCRDELERGGRTGATVNRYIAALSHAFTIAAREWQWIETNPILNVSKRKEARPRVRFLSPDERTRILDACQASKNPRLLTVVILALSTGARRDELWKLRWDQVDFAKERIVLHDTKNNDRRVLALKGKALEMMIQHSAVRRLDTDLVFPHPTRPEKSEDFRRAWEAAVKQAEISDFSWHDLRHTFASELAMSGATLAEIAAALGHKTLQMVSRYAHLADDHTADVVSRMNARIFSAG